MMAAYFEVAVKHFKKPADVIKAEAMKDLPGFLLAYEKWSSKIKATTGKKTEEEKLSGPCPSNGDNFTEKYCQGCPDRKGCTAWGTI